MRKSTAPLEAVSRNTVLNATSGKVRISIAKIPVPKTDWDYGVMTASGKISESFIGKWERA